METIERKTLRLIRYYVKITGSRDPLVIARHIGIGIMIAPLGNIAGNYKLIKRKRWIFINDSILPGSPAFNVVVAHELGHALLHRKENCAFIKNQTLLSTARIEREANSFAAQLLISDEMLNSFAGYTKSDFCVCTGFPKELIDLRIKNQSAAHFDHIMF